MTSAEKKLIGQYRRQGMGSTEIAEKLNLSVNTVKSYCRRNLIVSIQREKDNREYRAKRISLFMRMLAGQEECLEFDPAVFTAFVEKVVVSGTKKDVRLVFVLRDGSEYGIDGVR